MVFMKPMKSGEDLSSSEQLYEMYGVQGPEQMLCC